MRSRSFRPRIAAPIAAIALIAVAPTQAAAAQTIAPTQACFVNTPSAITPIGLTGTGWTPGDDIEITSSGGGIDLYGDMTATTSGTLTGTIDGADLDFSGPGSATTTITATDEGNDDMGTAANGQTASATVSIANLAVITVPQEAKPSKKVKYEFSGFISGRPVYGHYVHKKKVDATYRFGTASGPCGTLTVKAHFYPGRRSTSPTPSSSMTRRSSRRRRSRPTTPR